MSGSAVEHDHMQALRDGIKRRAQEGQTLTEITEWIHSNGWSPHEKHIGTLLAKTHVRRARAVRLDHYMNTLDPTKGERS